MRISDWSSDVCSSDLRVRGLSHIQAPPQSGSRIRGIRPAFYTASHSRFINGRQVLELQRLSRHMRDRVDMDMNTRAPLHGSAEHKSSWFRRKIILNKISRWKGCHEKSAAPIDRKR